MIARSGFAIVLAAAAAASSAALTPRTAYAHPLPHFDLAGLVIRSDAIVIADRVGPAPLPAGSPAGSEPPTRYHVVRPLRGAIVAGADLDLDDQLYTSRDHAVDGTAPPYGGAAGRGQAPAVEARVVLFLAHQGANLYIVPSGLRVVEGGKVFRFEQESNPGGFALVPQGDDPRDQWQAGTAQLDETGLERAIAAAMRRVDDIAVASAETDPAKRRDAMLALMPPAGVASAGGDFYVDPLARELEALLARGGSGDLEGALMVAQRDHTAPWQRDDFASLASLTAFATTTTNREDLRVLAIGAVARRSDYLDLSAVPAMRALLADPSPRIRAAAVDAVSRPAQWQTSDAAQQKAFTAAAHTARTVLAALYATETDPDVLYAIANAYDASLRQPLPTRKGGPAVVAHVRIDRGYVGVDVFCLRPRTRAIATALTATKDGAPVELGAFNISPHCAERSAGLGGGAPIALVPGRYALELALSLDKHPTKLALPTLIVDAAGEITLER